MPGPTPPRSSSFTTDVLKLVTGTTFAQFIVILASPLLTRLYGPEAFGFLALFHLYHQHHRGHRLHALRNEDHAPEDRRRNRKPAGSLPPQRGGGLRADDASPVLRGRCPPLPAQGARAWFILHPGFAVCLRRRGVSCVELLELACQPSRVTEVARVASSLAITGT
jgi:hypothetical protein